MGVTESADGPFGVVDGSVMMGAECDGVVYVTGAAQFPRCDVVDLAQCGVDSAAGCLAPTIPCEDGSALSWGEDTLSPALVEHTVVVLPDLPD